MLNTFCSDLLKYMLKHILLHLIPEKTQDVESQANVYLIEKKSRPLKRDRLKHYFMNRLEFPCKSGSAEDGCIRLLEL